MADILNIGVSALNVYKRALSTVGHNISNVNTPGYSRQYVELGANDPTRDGAGYLGNGVHVNTIGRRYDDFLASQVRNAQSASSFQGTLFSYAERINNLLGDPNTGLDSAMQEYFNAMQTVADDPASMAARQEVMSEASTLESRFNQLSQHYDNLRNSVNSDMALKISDANALATSIAEINLAITASQGVGNGKAAPDLLDQRDQLLRDLSTIVGISTAEQSDGAVNVFIGTGQTLVVGGTAFALSVVPNAADGASPDIAVSRGGSGQPQAITSFVTGGELGGLLEFRSDFLDEGQRRLGLTAVGLVEATNQQHALGLDLQGGMGGNLFSSLSFSGENNRNNTGNGTVDITFNPTDLGDLTTHNYQLDFDGTNWTATQLSDNPPAPVVFAPPAYSPASGNTIDGFHLAFTAGTTAWAAGDSFLLKPTVAAAGAINFALTDPRQIAAAAPLRSTEVTDANGNPVNTGSAAITQPQIATTTGIPLGVGLPMGFTFTNNAGGTGNPGFDITNGPAGPNDYILYDPTTADRFGKGFPDGSIPNQFSLFGGLTFEISGVPAVGDQFQVEDNAGGTGDNRNALALAGLQSTLTLSGGTNTFQETYSQLVSDVGSKTRYAEINYNAQEGLLASHEESLFSIAAVNLDEEAADLMRYQQAYQAAAQVINVAGTIFDTLLGAVRR